MTRRLIEGVSGKGVEYLKSADSVRLAHLVKIELPASTETTKIYDYVTDFLIDFTYKGNTYRAGNVVDISGSKESEGFRTDKLTVKTPGELNTELTRALADLNSQSYENKKVEIYRVYLDEANEVIPVSAEGHVTVFHGIINNVSITENITSGKSVVAWECSGIFKDFEKVNGRETTPESHKSYYPTDTGFDQSNKALDLLVKYMGTEKKYKIKKNWLGIATGVKEYEVEVEKEVDLDVTLGAKYLPIIYGVRKVPGIPVFMDVDKDDPSNVTMIYAFCEGEVDAFLNLEVEGKLAVCSNNRTRDEVNAETTTGACMGSVQASDTLSIYKMDAYNYSLAARVGGQSGKMPWDTGKDLQDQSISDIENALATKFSPSNDVTATEGTADGDYFIVPTDKATYTLTVRHGGAAQVADAEMVSKAAARNFLNQSELGLGAEYWDSNARLDNTAYMKVEFCINGDDAEIPEVSAVVCGRKVRIYSDPTTYVLGSTTNPVWHLLDYMTNFKNGGQIADVDIASFITTAAELDKLDTSYADNIDSEMTMWKYLGWKRQNADQATIMQCNTYIDTSKTVNSNINTILSQFNGSLNNVNGKYVVSLHTDSTPVDTISVGDVIGKITVKQGKSSKKFNSIQANIIDPINDWNATQVSFYSQSFLSQDNNIPKKGNINLQNITNYYTARAKAERELRLSRFNRDVSFKVGYGYSNIVVDDNILVDYPRFFATPQKFRVTGITTNSNGTIDVTAQMFDSSVFDITDQDGRDDTIDGGISSFPAIKDLEYVDLPDDAYTFNDDKAQGLLVWPEIDDARIIRYEVIHYSAQNVDDKVFADVTPNKTLNGKHYLPVYEMEDGVLRIFKVRIVFNGGEVSRYKRIEINPNSVQVEPAVYDAIQNLTSNAVGGVFEGGDVVLNWDAATVPSAPFYHIEVRSQGTLINSSYTSANTFTYALAQNLLDYAAQNANAVGAYRNLSLRVRITNGNPGDKFSNWTEVN